MTATMDGDARHVPSSDVPELRAQLPLAILMVALTSITLWSLGQNLVFEAEPEHQMPAVLLPLER